MYVNLIQFLIEYNCKKLIETVPFFQDLDPFFIKGIMKNLEVEHFIADDVVIEEGTKGEVMYFIAAGVLQVTSEGKDKGLMYAGAFFGEVALILGPMRRTAGIQAITDCVLYSLAKPALLEILKDYPDIKERLNDIAKARLRRSQRPKFSGRHKNNPGRSYSVSSRWKGSDSQSSRHTRETSVAGYLLDEKPKMIVPEMVVSQRTKRNLERMEFQEIERNSVIQYPELNGVQLIDNINQNRNFIGFEIKPLDLLGRFRERFFVFGNITGATKEPVMMLSPAPSQYNVGVDQVIEMASKGIGRLGMERETSNSMSLISKKLEEVEGLFEDCDNRSINGSKASGQRATVGITEYAESFRRKNLGRRRASLPILVNLDKESIFQDDPKKRKDSDLSGEKDRHGLEKLHESQDS
jgi:CRP-like cAMP-binding protein